MFFILTNNMFVFCFIKKKKKNIDISSADSYTLELKVHK